MTMMLLAAVLMALLFALCPLNSDDVWYMDGVYRASSLLERIGVVWRNVVDHMEWDTGRLANILSPVFLVMLPHWVFAVLTGAAVAMIAALGRRIGGVSRGSFSVIFILGVTILYLPWDDQIVSVIYALNYVWASVLILASIFIFTRLAEGSTLSRCRMALAFTLCLCAGWMHEGMSIPTLAGLAAYVAVSGRETRSNRRLWLLGLALAVGITLILISPATWVRTATERSMLVAGKRAAIELIMSRGAVAVAFIAVTVVALIFRPTRQRLLSDRHRRATVAMALTAVVASLAIAVACYTGPRNFWYPNLMAAIGLTAILATYKCPLAMRVTGMALISLAVVVNLGAAVISQRAVRMEYDRMMSLYRASATGTFFFDRPSDLVSPMALGKVGDSVFDGWMMPLHARVEGHPATSPRFETIPTVLSRYANEVSYDSLSACTLRGFFITPTHHILLVPARLDSTSVATLGDLAGFASSENSDDFITLHVTLSDSTMTTLRVTPIPMNADASVLWLKPRQYTVIAIHTAKDGYIDCWRHEYLPAIPSSALTDILSLD